MKKKSFYMYTFYRQLKGNYNQTSAYLFHTRMPWLYRHYHQCHPEKDKSNFPILLYDAKGTQETLLENTPSRQRRHLDNASSKHLARHDATTSCAPLPILPERLVASTQRPQEIKIFERVQISYIRRTIILHKHQHRTHHRHST